MIILNWLFVLALVGANGFFVAAEFALVKMRMGELRLLEREGRRGVKTTRAIMKDMNAYLSACQLGITFASLGLGWVGEPIIAKQLEPLVHGMGLSDHALHIISFAVAFGTITFLHITLGEQVPKIYAITRYQSTALAVGVPLKIFYKVFRPFIWLLNWCSNLMLKAVGIQASAEHGGVQSEAELRMLMRESLDGGHVSDDELTLLDNVLDLEDKIARSYMIPRHEVDFLNINDTDEVNVKKAAESNHTRLPICDGDLDKIKGIVHVKDIFRAQHMHQSKPALTDIAHEPIIAPETMKLDALMREFQRSRMHMAALVDEYGGVSGVITMENVLEEVVGPIEDEFDAETPPIKHNRDGSTDMDGSYAIEKAVKELDLKTGESTADTIGGLVVEALSKIPAEGEMVLVGDHEIKVLKADDKRVHRVRIQTVEAHEDILPTDITPPGDSPS